MHIWKAIPCRSGKTIRGMSKTLETLAFEVYDYLRHFLSSCVQLTSLEISAHSVDATSIGGCIVTCATVPIGISPEEFLQVLRKTEVKQQIEQLHEQHLGDWHCKNWELLLTSWCHNKHMVY